MRDFFTIVLGKQWTVLPLCASCAHDVTNARRRSSPILPSLPDRCTPSLFAFSGQFSTQHIDFMLVQFPKPNIPKISLFFHQVQRRFFTVYLKLVSFQLKLEKIFKKYTKYVKMVLFPTRLEKIKFKCTKYLKSGAISTMFEEN